VASDAHHGDVAGVINSFGQGEPILVHDAEEREDEIDLVYPADAVTPNSVARLRNDAGGLICVAIPPTAAKRFDLPFLSERLSHSTTEQMELGYDNRTAFSLPVNHRQTKTGITDEDRALTITKLAASVAEPDTIDFAAEFRSPGHVPILRAADGLLDTRHGHTELSIAIACTTDRSPAAVVCEMLDDETGKALSEQKARNYARRNGLQFIASAEIIDCLA